MNSKQPHPLTDGVIIALFTAACLCLLFFWPSDAEAADYNLVLGSHHVMMVDGDSELNEINLGASVTYDSGWQALAYHNSYSSVTVAGGKRLSSGVFGLELGVAAYGNFNFEGGAPLLPLAHATVDVGRVRLGVLPGDMETIMAVFTLQVQVN